MSIISNRKNMRAEVKRWRAYLFFLSLDWEPGGFIWACVKGGGCSGALCSCCPVSLSPPLCLDAFETGREGMWLRECKLRDEWLHVLSCF